jgi:hypothetical protein
MTKPVGCLHTPLRPPTFSSCTTGPAMGPRVCDEKLHPIPRSLAPGENENFGCWEEDLMQQMKCAKRIPAKMTQEGRGIRTGPTQSNAD